MTILEKQYFDFIFFGGAFDPPHTGHLKIIEETQKHFSTKIYIVPNYISPFKKNNLAQFKHRLQMCRILFKETSANVLDIESALTTPNYTINTINSMIQNKYGKSPALLFGDDQINSLSKWYNINELLQMCSIICIPRIHKMNDLCHSFIELYNKTLGLNLNFEAYSDFKVAKPNDTKHVFIFNSSLSSTASSDIRNRFYSTNFEDGLTPELESYIRGNGLYKN